MSNIIEFPNCPDPVEEFDLQVHQTPLTSWNLKIKAPFLIGQSEYEDMLADLEDEVRIILIKIITLREAYNG